MRVFPEFPPNYQIRYKLSCNSLTRNLSPQSADPLPEAAGDEPEVGAVDAGEAGDEEAHGRAERAAGEEGAAAEEARRGELQERAEGAGRGEEAVGAGIYSD